MSESLFPDLPAPARRFTVTVTLPHRTQGTLPDDHLLAELAAAAVCADGLVTAWTCSQAVLSMVLEAGCHADALTAGAAVARAMGPADGEVSVRAEPVPAAALTSRRGHDQAVVDEAVRLYRSGLSCREVSAALAARGVRVDPTTVVTWTVPRRRGRVPRDPVQDAEIIRLRDGEGLGFSVIAARLGIPRSTASQRYDAAKGIPRPRARKRG